MDNICAINLGSAYSKIAIIGRNGIYKTISYEEWFQNTVYYDRALASIIYFDHDNIIIGKIAKDYLENDKEHIISYFTPYIDKNVHYPIRFHNGIFRYTTQTYTPIELTTMLLKKLTQMDQENDETIKNVILTVPAYYSQQARSNTKTAAQMAGLNVVDMIDEPLAACYTCFSYDFKPGNILVYDLGASLDLTIVQADLNNDKQVYKIIQTKHIDAIGGKKIDDIIYQMIKQKLAETLDVSTESFSTDILTQIRLNIDSARERLSIKNGTVVLINIDNKTVEITITTEEFNQMIQPLIDQSMEHIELLNTSIDHILLIGGVSELPIIRSTLGKKYACVVDESFYHFYHPMNLAAIGAFQAYAHKIDNIERINNKMNNKIKGCIFGGAIGDALGYPIEFAYDIQEREHTRFNGIGYFSDDTQMTLFTAEGLIYQKKHDISYEEAIYQAYLDWYDTQRKTHLGKNICKIKSYHQLNHCRAPGNTCLSALRSGKMGTIDKPLNNSKGCGGVMRVAPAGIVFDNMSEAGKIGAVAGAITHGHPLGIIPCYVFSAMISILIHSDKNIEEALDLAMQDYLDHFDVFDKEYQKSFVSLINKAKELSKHNDKDTIAIPLIGGGWVGDEALAIAIYACLKYDNFEDAIICAANHDGDSDSTGAIAGNIMGAYLGYDRIPDYYKDNIEAKNILLEMSDALIKIVKEQ